MCVYPFLSSSINMPYKVNGKFFGRNLKLALDYIFAVILHINEQSKTKAHANTPNEKEGKITGIHSAGRSL